MVSRFVKVLASILSPAPEHRKERKLFKVFANNTNLTVLYKIDIDGF